VDDMKLVELSGTRKEEYLKKKLMSINKFNKVYQHSHNLLKDENSVPLAESQQYFI